MGKWGNLGAKLPHFPKIAPFSQILWAICGQFWEQYCTIFPKMPPKLPLIFRKIGQFWKFWETKSEKTVKKGTVLKKALKKHIGCIVYRILYTRCAFLMPFLTPYTVYRILYTVYRILYTVLRKNGDPVRSQCWLFVAYM